MTSVSTDAGSRYSHSAAENGMVASAHYLASQAGIWMLRQGGNAVDAAVCSAATIAVVAPHLNGVGGDLFAQVWLPEENRAYGLNASGRASRHASSEAMLSRDLSRLPVRGPLTVTVPGAVSGWAALLERFGTRRLFDVLEPAIDYAENGAPVTEKLAGAIGTALDLIREDPDFSRVMLRSGAPPEAGTAFSNLDLACSLREIGGTDGQAMYRGDLARRLAAGIQDKGGLIDEEDLAAHTVDWVEPIDVTFAGRTVLELPPNTQGVTALELLNLAELIHVDQMDPASPTYIDALTSIIPLAYEDRDRYMTDPAFADIPVETLISKEYAAERLRRNTETKATISAQGDTVYLCTVDSHRMAVSLIQSNYMGFGSGVMAAGTGIHLHNRGTYFSLDPTHVNCLAPRKRTMHTLIPALATSGGKLQLVFGSMGGDAQPQIHLQILLNRLVFGLGLQEAVEAPRFAVQSGGSSRLLLESRFDQSTIDRLRQMGHQVDLLEGWSSFMGHAQAIEVDRETGLLHGAADPRGDSAALGY